MKKKRLYKSNSNRVISGIFGGLDDYFNVDATILRLGFVFIAIFSGIIPGIIVYFIAALVVPSKS